MIFSNVYLFSTKLAYIYQFAKEEKNVTENTKTLLNTLFSMFEKFSEVYYTKDLKKVNEILQMKVELTDKINNSIEKKDGKIILQATMALRCIHDSIGALIGLISG
jgi:predicted ATP-grasp superfamily ATP-dependent carboligase